MLRATDVQGADDPARVLAAKRERAIRKAIAGALTALAGVLGGAAVLAMLSRYDAAGINGVLASDDAERSLIAGYQPIADLFVEAARLAANDNLGPVVYDPLKGSAAQLVLRQGFMDAVRKSQGDVLRLMLLDGVRNGLDAATVQARLQQVIGLTGQQAQAVLNFRRLLTTGDRTALTRALRDERYDLVVRRAMERRHALKAEQIDAMVARYAERMFEHRTETFARTEAMQAAVSGIRSAYVQAVDSGQLFDSEVRRFWLCCADERTCPVCASVPEMNRDGRGVSEPYVSLAGAIEAPLAHVNCRCSERYQADLTRLTSQPFAMAA